MSENPYLTYDDDSDKMDLDILAFRHREIKLLVDMDTVTVPEPQLIELEEVMNALVETFQEVTTTLPTKYKKYNQDQMERFIRVIQEEELTVPNIAEQCGIPLSSVYKLLNEFNASNGSVL